MLASVSVALLLLINAATSSPVLEDDAWVPLNWTLLPKAEPTDTVQVVYLVAPLLEDDVGQWLKYFRMFHGAIALINVNTGFSITINYDAENFVRSSLFPLIVKNGTDTELVFDNRGANFIYAGINKTYWTTDMQLVGTMNGTVYNRFMAEYDAATNTTNPFYDMFAVKPDANGVDWLSPWTCFDWAWGSFAWLHDNGVQWLDNVSLKATFANFYSKSAPEDVTQLYYTNAAEHERIVSFYEIIQVKFRDMGLLQMVLELVNLFGGDFYLRKDESFYKLKLRLPFVGVDYLDRPLPGQTR